MVLVRTGTGGLKVEHILIRAFPETVALGRINATSALANNQNSPKEGFR